jgi:hypothetical protein
MNLDDLTIEEVRAIQITDIRARLAARTPGSWLAKLDNHGWCIDAVLDEGTPKERMETLARLNLGSPASDTSDACFIASAADDIGVLLAEVERLNAERDSAYRRGVEQAIRSVEGEATASALRQAERLRSMLLDDGACRDLSLENKCKQAFRRGANAMREAAAQKVTSYNIVVVDPAGRAFPVLESPLQTLADELRALSIPEMTP